MPRAVKPFHYPHDQARRKFVEASVKAACLEILAGGVYPSTERIRARVKMSTSIVEDARARLIDSQAVPIARAPYRQIPSDDPLTEKPDAPDADEVQARIAAIRAEKEAAQVGREPLTVTTARYHRPNSKPHSRQRFVA